MSEETRRTVGKQAEQGIRAGIAAVLVLGIRQRNPGAVVNAAFALASTYIPAHIERRYAVEFRPWQRVYAELAVLTHSVGMLGPYDDVWWWDHLTHAHSATLLAGLVHGIARRRGRDPRPRVLAVVVGGGALWELVEFVIHRVSRRLGLEPLLVSYGRDDTAFDLLFDVTGGLIVLLTGDRLLENFHRSEDE